MRSGVGGRAGSSRAAIPCASLESLSPVGLVGPLPPAARTPALRADKPWQCELSSSSLTCRVGLLLLRLPSLAHDLVCPSLWSFFHDRLGRISLKSSYVSNELSFGFRDG